MSQKEFSVVEAANRFRETFEPKEGCNYDWVHSYARDHLGRLMDTFNGLDSKADSLIKYLGGATGLFALGTVAGYTEKNLLAALAILPSMLLALGAISLAVRARKPWPFPIPPSVEGAIRYVEELEKQPETSFLGQLHCTCEELRVVVMAKARLVRWANSSFLAAVWGLLLPVVVTVGPDAIRLLKDGLSALGG